MIYYVEIDGYDPVITDSLEELEEYLRYEHNWGVWIKCEEKNKHEWTCHNLVGERCEVTAHKFEEVLCGGDFIKAKLAKEG